MFGIKVNAHTDAPWIQGHEKNKMCFPSVFCLLNKFKCGLFSTEDTIIPVQDTPPGN